MRGFLDWIYHHDGGRDCRSAVLRGDHHCDVVWWSELSRAARDMVDVVAIDVVGARWSCLGRGRRGRSSVSSSLDGWNEVDLVLKAQMSTAAAADLMQLGE